MVNPELFMAALRDFVATMGRGYDLTEMCYQLCDRVTHVVSAAGAGVAVTDDGGSLRFVTGTSDRVVRIEAVQDHLQTGPCVTAAATQEPVVVGDIATVSEWGKYREAATGLGFRAVVGFPLSLGSERIGALNVYNDEPRQWTNEVLTAIGVFADMATAYLVRESQLQEATILAAQLQTALDSRVVIEQAKGMVATQLGVSVDRAFEILRDHARTHHLKLRAVAEAVVATGLRVPDPKT
jgi:GAF domain-containing protein